MSNPHFHPRFRLLIQVGFDQAFTYAYSRRYIYLSIESLNHLSLIVISCTYLHLRASSSQGADVRGFVLPGRRACRGEGEEAH